VRNSLVAAGVQAGLSALGPAIKTYARGASENLPEFIRGKRKQLANFKRLAKAARTPAPVVVHEQIVMPPPPPKRKHKQQSYNQTNSAKTVTITNSEFVTTLNSPGTGNTNQGYYIVSPEQTALFPWLSQIVTSWTQYRLRNVRFRYVPSIGSYSTTGAIGSMVMAYDADSSSVSQPFTSRPALLALQNKIEKRLDLHSSLKANAGRLLPWYDVGANVGAEEQFSDIGLFYFNITGNTMTAGSALGDLFVDYTIEMRMPRLKSISTTTGTDAHVATSTENASSGSRLGTAWAAAAGTMPTTAYTIAANSITLNDSGKYLIAVEWTASDAGITSIPSLTLTGEISYVTTALPPSGNLSTFNSGTASCQSICFVSKVSLNPGIITYAGLASMSNARCDIHIVGLSAGYDFQSNVIPLIERVLRRHMPGIFTRQIRSPEPAADDFDHI
jgi:hypothetical protein